MSGRSVTLRVVVSISGWPLFLSTVGLLLVSHCFSVLCHSYCPCFAFTGFLWFILSDRLYFFFSQTDLTLLSVSLSHFFLSLLLSQFGLTRCWSVTRSSIWGWWRIWGWGEPALLTGGATRSSCRGDDLLVFYNHMEALCQEYNQVYVSFHNQCDFSIQS